LSDESKTSIKLEIFEKLGMLVTAAFGLVAALAWNQAITKIFIEILGTSENISAMVIYALVVSVFTVVLTIGVARASSKAKKGIDQEIFNCSLCSYQSKVESEFMEHMIKEHSANPEKFLVK